MKILKIVALVLVVVALVAVWLAPLGPLPGVFIGGTAAPVPQAWGETADIQEIKLEVATGMVPRVVIIWVVQVDGALHVIGSGDSGWTQAIGPAAPVRMRMGDNTYSLQATRVTSGVLQILEAYTAKYRADYPEIVAAMPSAEEAVRSAAVFRLSAPGRV